MRWDKYCENTSTSGKGGAIQIELVPNQISNLKTQNPTRAQKSWPNPVKLILSLCLGKHTIKWYSKFYIVIHIHACSSLDCWQQWHPTYIFIYLILCNINDNTLSVISIWSVHYGLNSLVHVSTSSKQGFYGKVKECQKSRNIQAFHYQFSTLRID